MPASENSPALSNRTICCIIIRMDNEFKTRLEKIESVLGRYLPKSADEKWAASSFGNIDACIGAPHFAQLLEPTRNLLELGGKRWRPLLLVLCAEMASRGDEKMTGNAYELTPLVEFAHTASLIHDDIEDSADTRRGKPAAHIAFGLDRALNAASWLYFQAVCCTGKVDADEGTKSALTGIFMEELRRLHLGQAMDIMWHRNPEMIPSADEYKAMVRNKTGTLARLAVKVGIIAGGAGTEKADEAGKIAEDIGTGFQIIDDVVNLTTGNPGKKRGDDIVEGKKSLPVLLHLESNPGDAEKLASLFRKAHDEGIYSPAVEEAISVIAGSGAIEKARKAGNAMIEEKSAALSGLFGTDGGNASILIGKLFASMKK